MSVLGRLNVSVLSKNIISKNSTTFSNATRNQAFLSSQQRQFHVRRDTLFQEADKTETSKNSDEVKNQTSGTANAGLKVYPGVHINLEKQTINKYFPEGMNLWLKKEINSRKDTFNSVGRMQLIEAAQFLSKAKDGNFMLDKSKPYMLIDGPAGSGKSITLAQLVYWARTNGWLTVYIPDAADFTGGSYIEESEREPGMYDQPDTGAQFCKNMLAAHSTLLKQIPLKRTNLKVGTYVPKENAKLSELLVYGATPDNVKYSCDVVHHFRRELNLITEFPVLIAIDSVNSFWTNSKSFADPKSEKQFHLDRLPAKRLTLIKEFMNFMNHGLVNGVSVAAVSRTQHGLQDFLPRVKDRSTVNEVPLMTLEETKQILEAYRGSNVIYTDLTEESSKFIWMLTGGKGTELARYCRTL